MRRSFQLAAATAGLALLAAGAGAALAQHEGHEMHALKDPGARRVEPGGLTIPDVRLTTQDGEEVDFYSDLVADRVVAMNFVFTTCTTICPPMGAIFGRLQKELAEASAGDVELISVSVDPVVDTPERLKAWAGRFDAGPGWTLVTGDKHEVDTLLKSLQVFTPDFSDHAPIVLVGNARTGVWLREYGMAPPARLAEAIESVRGEARP